MDIGDKITTEWSVFLTFIGQETIYRCLHDFTVLWWNQEIPHHGYDYRVLNWWYKGDDLWL